LPDRTNNLIIERNLMNNTSDATSSDTLALILSAFDHLKRKWRTAGGVSREVKLPLDVVEATINAHPEVFHRSKLAPGGIPLFGVRRKHLAVS
jgi:hypothetical protein